MIPYQQNEQGTSESKSKINNWCVVCEIASNWATETDFSILVAQLPVARRLVAAYITQHLSWLIKNFKLSLV